jgi:hypothetical protein
MIINTHNVMYHQGQMSNQSYNLRYCSQSLSSFHQDLNNNWHGTEMTYINQAIQKISSDLSTAKSNISSICSDISTITSRVARAQAQAQHVKAR